MLLILSAMAGALSLLLSMVSTVIWNKAKRSGGLTLLEDAAIVFGVAAFATRAYHVYLRG